MSGSAVTRVIVKPGGSLKLVASSVGARCGVVRTLWAKGSSFAPSATEATDRARAAQLVLKCMVVFEVPTPTADVGRSVQVEHLGQREHRLIRALTFELLEERAHLLLPLLVDGLRRHAGQGLLEVGRFEVA